MNKTLQRLKEWVSDLKIHPLLVLALWVFFTWKFIGTGYIQAAWDAARSYKRYVGPQSGA